ncbi:hypothetical protein ACFSC4_05875 [Deinococcus malanensis]|uniref:hypothetical protein n=1 Tax=Deinococcus malanensis TaxID=1706855 RepID=UPI003643A71C
MTAGAFSTTEETSAIRHWRAYGLALLPLALLGIMPVWTCLALCLVYALGVRSPMWAQLRLMLTLLLTAITAIAGFPVALQGVWLPWSCWRCPTSSRPWLVWP